MTNYNDHGWAGVAEAYGYESEFEFLDGMYWDFKKTPAQIGEMIGKSKHTVYQRLKKHNVKRRGQGGSNHRYSIRAHGKDLCVIPGCRHKRADKNKFTRYCRHHKSELKRGAFDDFVARDNRCAV